MPDTSAAIMRLSVAIEAAADYAALRHTGRNANWNAAGLCRSSGQCSHHSDNCQQCKECHNISFSVGALHRVVQRICGYIHYTMFIHKLP